jgi:voltage-gated potassium channel
MARKVRVPMFSTLHALARDPEGKILLGTAVTTILIGTIVYMWLEGWGWIDALYFSVVTLATVGFGDLHPTTDLAKLFTVVYILTGVGIIAGFVSEVARRRRDHDTTPVIDEIEHIEDEVAEGAATHRRKASTAVSTSAANAKVADAAGPESPGPTAV